MHMYDSTTIQRRCDEVYIVYTIAFRHYEEYV